MKKLPSLALVCITTVLTLPLLANTPHQRINEVTRSISKAQENIALEKNKISSLNNQIQQSDLSIERMNKAIFRLQRQLNNKQHSLAALEIKSIITNEI